MFECKLGLTLKSELLKLKHRTRGEVSDNFVFYL